MRRLPILASLPAATLTLATLLPLTHPSHSLAATIRISEWKPLFQGIELASGQQVPSSDSELTQQTLCLRIDLTQPGVELFTSPRCANCSLETVAENTSYFLEQWDVQVAVNGAFYSSSFGPNDVPLGTAEDVHGLAISQGQLVSPADESPYAASLLFTEDNIPTLIPESNLNTGLKGVYTAISGNHVLLLNGVNQQTPNPRDLDPRTALGFSADKRYLYLMTIDGRQSGWSEGSDFYGTAEWLKRYGASDGINVDGGGSTTMVTSDCQGSAVRLNRSSFVAAYGRERRIGHNFGVRARPLPSPLGSLQAVPDKNTAYLTWTTDVPATTRIRYGLTSTYELGTFFHATPSRSHVMTLGGLQSGKTYYFRAESVTESNETLTEDCAFTTLSSTGGKVTRLFDVTQSWTYNNTSLDGVAWMATDYDASGWLGSGPGLLTVENNSQVSPKNTPLPPGFGNPIPRTYYFRTHFNYTGNTAATSLTFSNYIDDGAVFYLNGQEIHRLRLPTKPNVISFSTAANALPCAGTAQSGDAATLCPDLFTLSPAELPSFIQGTNVLAVEVHNYTSGNDLTFGSALYATEAIATAPTLYTWQEGDQLTFFWNGTPFRLEESTSLDPNATWTEVTAGSSPSPQQRILTPAGSRFYRLSQP